MWCDRVTLGQLDPPLDFLCFCCVAASGTASRIPFYGKVLYEMFKVRASSILPSSMNPYLSVNASARLFFRKPDTN